MFFLVLTPGSGATSDSLLLSLAGDVCVRRRALSRHVGLYQWWGRCWWWREWWRGRRRRHSETPGVWALSQALHFTLQPPASPAHPHRRQAVWVPLVPPTVQPVRSCQNSPENPPSHPRGSNPCRFSETVAHSCRTLGGGLLSSGPEGPYNQRRQRFPAASWPRYGL